MDTHQSITKLRIIYVCRNILAIKYQQCIELYLSL